MTSADRHRLDAQRLRKEAAKCDYLGSSVFGVDIWLHLAAMHDDIADRLDELADTQVDLKAVE